MVGQQIDKAIKWVGGKGGFWGNSERNIQKILKWFFHTLRHSSHSKVQNSLLYNLIFCQKSTQGGMIYTVFSKHIKGENGWSACC